MAGHLANFDTHAAIKHLHAAGLDDKTAEAIVQSIAISKKSDLPNIVSKDDFFNFKSEVDSRFNSLDKEVDNINHNIDSLRKNTKAEFAKVDLKIDSLRKDTKAEIDSLRKDTKAEIDSLRKDVIAEVAKGKNDTIKWVIGLFVTQVISVVALLVTVLVKSHFST